jgi:hypothetical protein
MLIATKSIGTLMLATVLALAGFCSKATNFANQALALLDNYPTLLSGLNLPIDLNSVVVQDFKGLVAGATIMSDEFAAIPKDDQQSRPKHLAAVNAFGDKADAIFAHGNFDTNDKLKKVKFAVKAIVIAAKVYYSPVFGSGPNVKAQRQRQEQDLKKKLEELKTAMEP